MKIYLLIYLGVLSLLLTSCTFFTKKQLRLEANLGQTNDRILDQAKYMNDTTVMALARETNSTMPIDLARKTSTEAQRLLGMHPYERFDLDAYLTSNEVAWASLRAKFDTDTALLKMRGTQENKLEDTKDKLIAYGQKYEEERNSKIWWKFWTWSTGTLIFAGFIALCVLTPVGPALLSGVLGLLWKVVPGVMGFFKISHIKPLDNLLNGGESFKQRVVTEPVVIPTDPSKKFTYEDVQALLRNERDDILKMWKDEMNKATDLDDKHLIEIRKQKLNL
jgi:hypothetical protein